MIMHGDTTRDLANYLGISKQSTCNKINGKNTEFKQGEIALITKRYNLTPEKTEEIFFAE